MTKTTENGGGLSPHTIGDSTEGANTQRSLGQSPASWTYDHFRRIRLISIVTGPEACDEFLLALHSPSIHCSNHVQVWTVFL